MYLHTKTRRQRLIFLRPKIEGYRVYVVRIRLPDYITDWKRIRRTIYCRSLFGICIYDTNDVVVERETDTDYTRRYSDDDFSFVNRRNLRAPS